MCASSPNPPASCVCQLVRKVLRLPHWQQQTPAQSPEAPQPWSGLVVSGLAPSVHTTTQFCYTVVVLQRPQQTQIKQFSSLVPANSWCCCTPAFCCATEGSRAQAVGPTIKWIGPQRQAQCAYTQTPRSRRQQRTHIPNAESRVLMPRHTRPVQHVNDAPCTYSQYLFQLSQHRRLTCHTSLAYAPTL